VFTLTQSNVHELEWVVEFANQAGASGLTLIATSTLGAQSSTGPSVTALVNVLPVADAPVLGYFAERYRVPVVTVLRPFGAPAAAAWVDAVKATVAELPAVALLATAQEIPPEMRELGRPVRHVPVLDLPVDEAVRALAGALCAAGNAAAPVPAAPARP
jgi:hypothetical protein